MRSWLMIICSMFLSVRCKPDRAIIPTGPPVSHEKFLIVTADDFGASVNINEGIEIAADQKVITTISALTNFTESLPLLKKISEKNPEIGIGVHLNITTGKPVLEADQVSSLVNADGNFYPLEELLPHIDMVSVDELRNELRAQITALQDEGIKVDHLSDQNGIITLYSPFFDVMLELALEFKVPIRSPEIASIKYPDLFPNSNMNKYGRQVAARFAVSNPVKALSFRKLARLQEIENKVHKLETNRIPHPDLLIDYFWGNPTSLNFNYILGHLPDGISELILHVGTGTWQPFYPSGLDLDYFKNREIELATITNYGLKEYCDSLNIRIVGYGAISGSANKSFLRQNSF